MVYRVRLAILLPLVLVMVAITHSLPAQEAAVIVKESSPAAARLSRSKSRSRKSGGEQAKTKKPDAAKKSGDQSSSKDKKEEKKDDASGPKPVQRPTSPSTPADPEELKARPDEEGMVMFSFQGQPWPDVLDWLADISKMTLDWNEVPGGFVNLTSRTPYTVEETRDRINSLLLARGFTLLRDREVLHVVNIKKELDPAMVPRVSPEQLKDREPHEFAKVSFKLSTLLAETAAKELKEFSSKNGKLTALKTTNRLEVMDAVSNLRDIYRVLSEEQSQDGQEGLMEWFPLEHTRAADVKVQLEALLGLEAKKPAVPMSRQQMQMAQQMAQMQAQAAAKVAKPPTKEKIYIVAVERDNSILVNAPADKIAVIRQAIKVIDQPARRASLAKRMQQDIQVHRLAGLDPESLVETLYKLGDLDPKTHLEVDAKHKAIIAFASFDDQVTIAMLIKKLDGSGRRFHVIRLRRLAADYVAGSIEFMMGAGEKEEKQQGYGYWYRSYGRGNEKEEESEKFRVDADVDNNRLLLYANDIELEQINSLLKKLGEIPPEGSNRSRLRVLEIEPGKKGEDWLERLRRAWDGPNELILPDEAETKAAPPENRRPRVSPKKSSGTNASVQEPKFRRDPIALARRAPVNQFDGVAQLLDSRARQPFIQLAQFRQAETGDAAPAESRQREAQRDASPEELNGRVPDWFRKQVQDRLKQSSGKPARIKIMRGPDGKLKIYSDDLNALDRLEALMRDMAPPRKDYIFLHLKHAEAWWVAVQLEDFFEEEQGQDERYPSWYNYQPAKKKPRYRLSSRRPLKFVADDDTHTILVRGADSGQLATIHSLLEVFDQPPLSNAQAARQYKVFHIRNSKARIIADAIKDVFRDLLSPDDKARQNGQQKDKKPNVDRIYTYIEDDGDDKRSKITFKGNLSIGVDELSNALIISAPANLLHVIGEMVVALDEAARTTSTVGIVQIDRRMNAEVLQKRLSEILRRRTPGKDQKQPSSEKNGEGKSNQSESNVTINSDSR